MRDDDPATYPPAGMEATRSNAQYEEVDCGNFEFNGIIIAVLFGVVAWEPCPQQQNGLPIPRHRPPIFALQI